jgi:hypothetical protein
MDSRDEDIGSTRGLQLAAVHWGTAESNCGANEMKYVVAWLLGVPLSLIVIWFAANQIGC